MPKPDLFVPQDKLKACPKCRGKFFRLNLTLYFIRPHHTMERHTAFCNTRDCPEEFWYHPRTGRITEK